MNTEDSKIVRPDEVQNANGLIDRSRRSFAKVGVVAPVIMTLNSKVALGTVPYHCTVSGKLSGNHSSHHDWDQACPTGCQVKHWKNNCATSAPNNPNGHIEDWKKCGVRPYSITKTSTTKKTCKFPPVTRAFNPDVNGYDLIKNQFGLPGNNNVEYPATTCNTVFGNGVEKSFYEVLATRDRDDVLYCAVADYLNVGSGKLVIDGINKNDIVNIYKVATGNLPSCPTSGGSTVTSASVAGSFLQDICPLD